jgi:regulator of RNase E activity RraA
MGVGISLGRRPGQEDHVSVNVAEERALFDQLQQELYTAVVSDVLDHLGYRDQAMDDRLRPAWSGAVLVGRAHTMLASDRHVTLDDPYGLEIEAIDTLPENGVMVASTNRSTRTCIWGELLSTASRARGGRGAIVDGFVRDVRAIEAMAFPVFATGMRPVDSAGRSTIVSYNEPVEVGGVVVHPGEIVIADIDGIVVIPRDVEHDAIAKAREKVAGENAMRDYLREGNTLRSAFDRFGLL